MSFLGIFSTRRVPVPWTSTSTPSSNVSLSYSWDTPQSATVSAVEDETTLKIIALLAEEKRLRHQCQELSAQSQLNQDLFQQCSNALLSKEQECEQLQELNAQHLSLIENLRAGHQSIAPSHIGCIPGIEVNELHEQLRIAQSDAARLSQQVELQSTTFKAIRATCTSLRIKLDAQQEANVQLQQRVDSAQMKEITSQDQSTGIQQIHPLKEVIKPLNNEPDSRSKADAREGLICKLKEQQQHLIELCAVKAKKYAQQDETIRTLKAAKVADCKQLQAEVQSQRVLVAKLQAKLHSQNQDTEVPAARCDQKLAEPHHRPNADQLNFELASGGHESVTEIADQEYWIQDLFGES